MSPHLAFDLYRRQQFVVVDVYLSDRSTSATVAAPRPQLPGLHQGQRTATSACRGPTGINGDRCTTRPTSNLGQGRSALV